MKNHFIFFFQLFKFIYLYIIESFKIIIHKNKIRKKVFRLKGNLMNIF